MGKAEGLNNGIPMLNRCELNNVHRYELPNTLYLGVEKHVYGTLYQSAAEGTTLRPTYHKSPRERVPMHGKTTRIFQFLIDTFRS